SHSRPMTHRPQEIAARELSGPERFRELIQECRPRVIRGLVAEWPIVRAATEGAGALRNYMAPFAVGADVEVFIGDPAIRGKYYYNSGLQGFNFERRTM